ncbi:MAG: methyltransferase [Bacillota bacterium]|nr:methyltransferase [Bacillota bacterium]
MSKIRKDYFMSPEHPIFQREDMFHFNTDTKLLAGFLKIKKNETVLDIGTNNGALLLACDQYPVKQLIGVEVLKEACEVAQMNVDHFITHPCQIINAPIQDVQVELVDVIISNPPYFSQKETNPNIQMDFRQLGRLEINLTLEELIFHTARLLKSNGRFYMVHRPNRIQEIIHICTKNNMGIKRIQVVYDHRDNEAKSLLIEAIKERNCQCKILSPLYI